MENTFESEESCENCVWEDEGVCYECAGDNYGCATEIGGEGWCENWEENYNTNDERRMKDE